MTTSIVGKFQKRGYKLNNIKEIDASHNVYMPKKDAKRIYLFKSKKKEVFVFAQKKRIY